MHFAMKFLPALCLTIMFSAHAVAQCTQQELAIGQQAFRDLMGGYINQGEYQRRLSGNLSPACLQWVAASGAPTRQVTPVSPLNKPGCVGGVCCDGAGRCFAVR